MKNRTPRLLDDQEKLIARELIKNPRSTDKHISDVAGAPLRTVGRRRQRLEEEGLLRYWAEVDLSRTGASQHLARHLYILRFRTGITLQELQQRVAQELSVLPLSDLVYESHIAESDGRLSLVLILEGPNEADLVESVHNRLIPQMMRNHGDNAIEDVSAIRLVSTVRKLRNYLPAVNMDGPRMLADWDPDKVYVGY